MQTSSFSRVRFARTRAERGPNGRVNASLPGYVRDMRLMFFTWISLITAGIVFFSIVGLTHG
jgi:hypothetical protein